MNGDIIKASVADNLDIPKEVLMNIPVITVSGKDEMTIENFKDIRDFSEEHITINTKISKVKLTGTGLEISYLTKETLTVKGCFKTLEFG
ncbi:MAG: sporulation protein YqfC [Firmicutes bacterium]|nr:sporulation protein YqfC [Bacillota bacterium]